MMLEHVINYVCESGVSISAIPLIQDFDPSSLEKWMIVIVLNIDIHHPGDGRCKYYTVGSWITSIFRDQGDISIISF